MRKSTKLFLIASIVAYLTPMLVQASPISKVKMMEYAKEAYRQKVIIGCGISKISDPKDYYFIGSEHNPLMLVMNYSQGFVMISADDAVQPVLAYSSTSNLYLENVAPATLLFIEQYKKEISFVRENEVKASEDVKKQWENLRNGTTVTSKSVVVAPLITATWNQTKYYNQYSPIDHESPTGYDSRTPNGCVAVAMAMIMYYYRYPLQGTGSHTNYTEYGNFTVDYSQQHYNYNAMSDELNFYNNEVAKLIFHAATSVDMHYTPEGSGAYSQWVPDAMATYFRYGSNATYKEKNSVSGAAWRSMLRTELDAGHPVFYSGYSDDGGGHAFVCDGYDSDNLFHFNFGWGGVGNGFFSTSSSSSNAVGGYGNWQGAIFDLYPAYDYPYYCNEKVVTAVSGTLEDGSNSLPYQNNANCTYVIAPTNMENISVHIQRFDTEDGHDSLSFWNGNPQDGNLLLTLTGGMPSSTTYSFEVDTLYITFKTDEEGVASGWRLDYEAFTQIMPCHSGSYTSPSGYINDGSEDEPYRYNAYCIWRLRIPQASYIGLSFTEMDISPEDGLYVYDASTSPAELVQVYTGNTLPFDKVFYTNNLSIRFVSDNDLNGQGFRFAWYTDLSEGIEENISEDVKVFPNPSSSIINVKLNGQFVNPTIRVLDVTGRQVYYIANCNTDIVTLNVRSLSAGVYTLICTENGKSVKKKLIVSHR